MLELHCAPSLFSPAFSIQILRRICTVVCPRTHLLAHQAGVYSCSNIMEIALLYYFRL
jgi:hypothetical protein